MILFYVFLTLVKTSLPCSFYSHSCNVISIPSNCSTGSIVYDPGNCSQCTACPSYNWIRYQENLNRTLRVYVYSCFGISGRLTIWNGTERSFLMDCSQKLGNTSQSLTDISQSSIVFDPTYLSFAQRYLYYRLRVFEPNQGNRLVLGEVEFATNLGPVPADIVSINRPNAMDGSVNVVEGTNIYDYTDLIVKYSRAIPVHSYRISSQNELGRATFNPSIWELAGSNDGNYYDTIDYQPKARIPDSFGTFSDWFTTNLGYRYLRFNLTLNRTGVSLSSVQFWLYPDAELSTNLMSDYTSNTFGNRLALLFDNDPSSTLLLNQNILTITIKFSTAISISSYGVLCPINNFNRFSVNYISLEASNDAINFYVLDARNSVSVTTINGNQTIGPLDIGSIILSKQTTSLNLTYKVDCPLGYIGDDCSKLCCDPNKGLCDYNTGFCSKCNNGWKGKNCNTPEDIDDHILAYYNFESKDFGSTSIAGKNASLPCNYVGSRPNTNYSDSLQIKYLLDSPVSPPSIYLRESAFGQVKFPEDIILKGEMSWTIELWLLDTRSEWNRAVGTDTDWCNGFYFGHQQWITTFHYGECSGNVDNDAYIFREVFQNRWYHYAIGYDYPNRTMFIYQDGRFVTKKSKVPPMKYSGRVLLNWQYSAISYISEVRIWKKTLTVDEVRNKMSRSLTTTETMDPSLMGYYPMNKILFESTQTPPLFIKASLSDSSSYKRKLNLDLISELQIGGSQLFGMPTIPSNPVAWGTGALTCQMVQSTLPKSTISLWIYYESSPVLQRVVPIIELVTEDNLGANSGIQLLLDESTEAVTCRVWNSIKEQEYFVISGSTVIGLGWKHIACTYDGYVHLFVDGVLDESISRGHSVQLNDTTKILHVGHSTEPLSNGIFNGIVDNLRVYDTILSAPLIYNLYTTNMERLCTCSGHGVCNVTTKQCTCSSNYYGSECHIFCSNDNCGNGRRCNTDGLCTCYSSSQSRYDPADNTCNTCLTGYYGNQCNLQCSCNSQPCNKTSGICNCYNDTKRGFWRGSKCDQCQKGYSGSMCLIPGTNTGSRPSPSYIFPSLSSTELDTSSKGLTLIYSNQGSDWLIVGLASLRIYYVGSGTSSGQLVAIGVLPQDSETRAGLVSNNILYLMASVGRKIHILSTPLTNLATTTGRRVTSLSMTTVDVVDISFSVQEATVWGNSLVACISNCKVTCTPLYVAIFQPPFVSPLVINTFAIDSKYMDSVTGMSAYEASLYIYGFSFTRPKLLVINSNTVNAFDIQNDPISIMFPTSKWIYAVLEVPPCPGGWVEANGNCYRLYLDQQISFNRALHMCEQQGGTLPTPMTASDMLAMYQLCYAVPLDSSCQFWIGVLRNPDTSRWEFLDGTQAPSIFWGRNQPSDWDECTQFNSKFWVSSACNSFSALVCAIPSRQQSTGQKLVKYPTNNLLGSLTTPATTTTLPVQDSGSNFIVVSDKHEWGYVSVHSKNLPSIIYPFDPETLQVMGKAALDWSSNTNSVPNITKAAVLDPVNRYLYSTVTGKSKIIRFSLHSVSSVSPSVVDSYSNTTIITVTGKGFSDLPSLQCLVDGKPVGVSYKSSTTLLCIAPPKDFSRVVECDCGLPVEVLLYNGTYSMDDIRIQHVSPPVVLSLVPGVYFIPSPPSAITIFGRGFLQTPTAGCQFIIETPSSIYLSKATDVSPGSLVCPVPRITSPTSITVEVTLDGNTFTDNKIKLVAAIPPTAPSESKNNILALGIGLGILGALLIAAVVAYLLYRVTTKQRIMSHVPKGYETTLVFTDIQNSTHLWSNYEMAMKEALLTHNKVIRRAIAKHRGYEIKTIGDSFMVAFHCPKDALNFAQMLQDDLIQQPWPVTLLKDENCAVEEHDGKLIWNGLRVRVGINSGDVDLEYSANTKKVDYFGPTVNLAARVEGLAAGGQTLISETVYHSCFEDTSNLIFLGNYPLKGAGNQDIYEMVCVQHRSFPKPVKTTDHADKSDQKGVCISCLRPCKYCKKTTIVNALGRKNSRNTNRSSISAKSSRLHLFVGSNNNI